VHHDLWDMDIGGQPSLVDLDTPKGRIPALIASTKRADLYVIDRRDGSLIVPMKCAAGMPWNCAMITAKMCAR